MISHLTNRERVRISLKLYDKDRNLWRRFKAVEDRYKQAKDYERWFYEQLKDYRFERDINYYIERHKRKLENPYIK